MFDILENKPKVLVQGITGKHGSFHTEAMLASGTQIVAGVVPGGEGKTIHDIPVFNTITDTLGYSDIDVSVVFVPAPFCKDALLEAVYARIPLIICITEGLPLHDFLYVKKLADQNNVHIVGPNCPGILMPGIGKFGIIPTEVGMPGNVAIASRSGTLVYEVADALTVAGIGQRIIIGLGGDPVKGKTFVDCLKEFEEDDKTKSIVLVGEIGGHDEQIAAEYIKKHSKKPVFAYVTGHYAPLNKQLGHAGAIIRSGDETAKAKTTLLSKAGVKTATSVDYLVELIIGK
ncbi:MAG: succinate--CoA ligase subunit alpha [Candidatus Uhrbacteria bacterium]|nr:succinate--CoA ligase subunit alpha [Candidatus Uhrbacteria bacterium]